ncbi:hypothetical protein RD792_006809 [Penstemon davidsonii]|uniref:Uncharacterized protein n=1 Tax=Penstemon davidsonii TaxID=160366 RepID=A0ABR0DBN3_9LAMI|nr:hypothetical protein RD792_006809 [Penstemon davidsonii]
MSSPSSYGRSLESTPTWAVAVVVFVLVAISLVIEQIIHHVGSGRGVQFVSAYGIHQLHIFIFVLAISHILYCLVTLGLGRLKVNN